MKYFTSLILAITILFLPACATIQEQLTLAKAPQLINSIVPSAVKIGIAKEPRAIPYLRALSTVIKGFALGQDLTPEALEQAIKSAKVDELQTPEAIAVVTSVVGLYKAYYGSYVEQKIADKQELVAVLNALVKAIDNNLPAQ